MVQYGALSLTIKKGRKVCSIWHLMSELIIKVEKGALVGEWIGDVIKIPFPK